MRKEVYIIYREHTHEKSGKNALRLEQNNRREQSVSKHYINKRLRMG